MIDIHSDLLSFQLLDEYRVFKIRISGIKKVFY